MSLVTVLSLFCIYFTFSPVGAFKKLFINNNTRIKTRYYCVVCNPGRLLSSKILSVFDIFGSFLAAKALLHLHSASSSLLTYNICEVMHHFIDNDIKIPMPPTKYQQRNWEFLVMCLVQWGLTWILTEWPIVFFFVPILRDNFLKAVY